MLKVNFQTSLNNQQKGKLLGFKLRLSFRRRLHIAIIFFAILSAFLHVFLLSMQPPIVCLQIAIYLSVSYPPHSHSLHFRD